MRANPIRSLMLLAAMAVLALAPVRSAAQDFPARPVRFIVPYAAGGSGDLLARLLGNKLAAIWGQQVVVDNRAGGGGLIGTEFAARSDPDGYTLYLATDGPLTVAASLYKRVPYDWKRDFAPVSMLAMGYQVLIVRASLPARDLKELIALAREKPGELNYASIGIGSAPHLGAELLKSVAKVDVTHVPYRGSSAQAISALLAGDVAMFLVGTSTAVP
ncbi:MAG: Bug family tripartite tricarboxylate transporter substrate binding protein, partial [Xanthobacteraceae bacterium]